MGVTLSICALVMFNGTLKTFNVDNIRGSPKDDDSVTAKLAARYAAVWGSQWREWIGLREIVENLNRKP